MEQPEEHEDDRFQDLPEEFLTKIAGHLPLKDSARTSILSRQWRYAWRKTPNPHFDGNNRTEFRTNGCPISCFETLADFYNWMDKMIRRLAKDEGIRGGFRMESLSLNLLKPGPLGSVEFRYNSDDSVVIGGFKVVRLLSLSSSSSGIISLSDWLSRQRPNLLVKLTLQMSCTECHISSGGLARWRNQHRGMEKFVYCITNRQQEEGN